MKKLTFFFLSIMMAQMAFSQQSVGIGTSTPAASAKLDVSSTTQGMLVPRMTTAQRIAISSPASGLLVFDLTTNSFWFKGGTTWVQLVDSVHTEVHRNGPSMIYAGMTDNVGIGVLAPANKLDISDGLSREGTHATNRPLYVTGDIGPNNNGIEFRHSYGTVGIGFGYNTIYAAGSNVIQDLGIQAKGAFGNLLFSTNDTERMRVTGDGKVGIGVVVPANRLDISDNSPRTGTHPTNRPLYVTGNMGPNSGIEFRHYNGTQGIGFGYNTIYATGSDASQNLGIEAKGSTGNVLFSTNGNERMRVTGDGRVGIGLTSPDATLEITRGTAPYGALQIDGTNYNSHFNYGTEENTYIRGGKPGAKVIINEYGSPGNVGVGTDNPLQKLHVAGKLAIDNNVGIGNTDPHAPLQFSNADQNRKMVLYEVNNNDHEFVGFGYNAYQLRYQSNGDHVFYKGEDNTTSNELMRITSIGRVGIGQPFPAAMLEIARGTAVATLKLNGTTNFSYFNLGDAEDTYIRAGKAGGKVLINDFGDSGNVGIGKSNPAEKLDVNGNIALSGSLKVGYTRIFGGWVDVLGFTNGSASCNCTEGLYAIGGGFEENSNGIQIIKSYANGDSSWFVYVYNGNGFTTALRAFVICARLAN